MNNDHNLVKKKTDQTKDHHTTRAIKKVEEHRVIDQNRQNNPFRVTFKKRRERQLGYRK